MTVLKVKMLRVVLTQLVLLCPQCHTAKQNSLKLESTLAMCHSERLLHKSMHFAAKQQRPHQLTLKTKRQMHSMVHDVKIRTIEATDQQIRSESKNSKSERAKSASDTLEWPGLSACTPINQKQIMNRRFRGKRNFLFSFPPTLPGSTRCAHGKAMPHSSRCPLPPGSEAVHCRSCAAHCPQAVKRGIARVPLPTAPRQ